MNVQQIVFIVVLALVTLLAIKLYGRVIANIRMGKAWAPDGTQSTRWKNLFLVAFGQRKMFKKILPAIFHLFIYVAFLLTQIELVEILIDGVFGVHRFFSQSLGSFYTFVISSIEMLSLLALVATLIFLWRRNIKKVVRFEKPEMTGWPKLDANLILVGELLLIIGIFSMNSADAVLQSIEPEHYPQTGQFLISGSMLSPMVMGLDPSTLVVIERAGWWLHILVVFGFILYLPISKHLHILFAFPNTYFAKQSPKGGMTNMPAIMNEVKSMMGLSVESQSAPSEIPEFGANDVTNLTWKNLLDAYTCTECGRCTAVCPANITGKKLSPRKIMMDVRDRTEEVGRKLASLDSQYIGKGQSDSSKLTADNFDDGKSLFDLISPEEIHACTTCNACVDACPVLINPLDIILEMRRYEILTMGAGPQDWVPMFTSLENSGAVWQVAKDRDAWITE